jgi:hypothetical protein
MAAQILTVEDFQQFKAELFRELQLLVKPSNTIQQRKWLKSYEVREMLGISPGTLQTMRANRSVAYTKIGGLVFYDYDDIIKLMEADKKHVQNRRH